jgi:hypothetical protein
MLLILWLVIYLIRLLPGQGILLAEGIGADENKLVITNTAGIPAGVLVDGDFTSQGIMLRGAVAGSYSILTDNSTSWNTAFGWGDHASAGYVTGTPWTGMGYLTALPAHNLIDFTVHAVVGLTTGHFLKATGATTYGFAAHGLTYSDVGAADVAHLHTGTYLPVAGAGDIYTHNASEFLTSVTAHNLLSATHGDTTASSCARGSVIVGDSSSKWVNLAFPGTPTGKVLIATATDVAWSISALGSNAYTSTSYLPIAGGTLTGHLLFTDNTYDIGASGVTRPRTGYFGTALYSPNIYLSTLTSGRIPIASTNGQLTNSADLSGSGTRSLNITAAGALTAGSSVLDWKIIDATTITNIINGANWTLGIYGGPAITGQYEGYVYRDDNYKYEMYTDTEVIRTVRG